MAVFSARVLALSAHGTAGGQSSRMMHQPHHARAATADAAPPGSQQEQAGSIIPAQLAAFVGRGRATANGLSCEGNQPVPGQHSEASGQHA